MQSKTSITNHKNQQTGHNNRTTDKDNKHQETDKHIMEKLTANETKTSQHTSQQPTAPQ